MNKKTQYQIIKDRLLEAGEISRNWCLQLYITRLSAYILDLKKEGWDFNSGKVGGDYVYTVTKKPVVKVPIKLVDYLAPESPNTYKGKIEVTQHNNGNIGNHGKLFFIPDNKPNKFRPYYED